MNDPAPTLPEDIDVERLLAEAERMSRDLSAEALDTDVDLTTVPFEPLNETGAARVSGSSAVEHDIHSLNDLLHDPDAASSHPTGNRQQAGVPSQRPLDTPSMPEQTADGPDFVREEVRQAALEPAKGSVLYVDDSADVDAADATAIDERLAQDAAAGFAGHDGEPRSSESRAGSDAEGETAFDAGDDGAAPPDSAGAVVASGRTDVSAVPFAAPHRPGTSRGISQIARSGIAWTFGAIRRAPSAALWPLVMLIVLLNRPFEGLSDNARRIVGIVGIATLLAGAAMWILPPYFEHNPFLAIDAASPL